MIRLDVGSLLEVQSGISDVILAALGVVAVIEIGEIAGDGAPGSGTATLGPVLDELPGAFLCSVVNGVGNEKAVTGSEQTSGATIGSHSLPEMKAMLQGVSWFSFQALARRA